MDEAFRQKVEAAAQGRQLKYIRLHKPEGTSLGFRYNKMPFRRSVTVGPLKTALNYYI